MLVLALLCLLCALIPAALFRANLNLYLAPPEPTSPLPAVSVLIPARNEEAAIGDAIRAVLTSEGIDLEVIVMDDSSTDRTAEIVRSLALIDPRVRLEQAPSLPKGWNGKQHACWALAQTALNPILCFVDADVRLQPACLARMTAFLASSESSLVTGFPRQITGSFLEWLLLPLIHFVLLGFLPISRMRASTDPAFAAGCGQFMLANAQDYFACGGHSGIKLTMHDGLRLPRLFRASGFRTDLADITDLATCRMYTNGAQVWSGLAKNATEGIADPKRIVPASLVLFLGQVLPSLLLLWTIFTVSVYLTMLLHHGFMFYIAKPFQTTVLLSAWFVAILAAYLPRIWAAKRFQQDWRGAVLHPFGVLLLLAIQWFALIRKLRGGPVSWRNRTYEEN